MKKLIANAFPASSCRGWILRGYFCNPVRFNFALLRSVAATYRLTGRVFPVCVRVQPGIVFSVSLGKAAKIRIDGVFTVTEWGGSRASSSLSVGSNASLIVQGDFEIGPDVHISVSADAELVLGGRKNSSASGITCDSRIMAAKRIHIGADTIIAWGVFITDSDWHKIEGACREEEVVIGEHVWIAHDASVLKGAFIPQNSIVAAKSLVQGKFSSSHLLLAGVPARIVREGIQWER